MKGHLGPLRDRRADTILVCITMFAFAPVTTTFGDSVLYESRFGFWEWSGAIFSKNETGTLTVTQASDETLKWWVEAESANAYCLGPDDPRIIVKALGLETGMIPIPIGTCTIEQRGDGSWDPQFDIQYVPLQGGSGLAILAASGAFDQPAGVGVGGYVCIYHEGGTGFEIRHPCREEE